MSGAAASLALWIFLGSMFIVGLGRPLPWLGETRNFVYSENRRVSQARRYVSSKTRIFKAKIELKARIFRHRQLKPNNNK